MLDVLPIQPQRQNVTACRRDMSYDASMNPPTAEKYANKYVRLTPERNAWNGNFSEDYQETIDEHARQGWRFVQAFAPAVFLKGSSKFVDLIFEKRAS